MVQGLAFLSKKSWHTKNLSNQSKVWQAEQQKEAEDSKTKELARQIAQEREQEELDRISGKKTTIDRGIDWMYQGGTTGDLAKEDAARKAEEFLLGKEYVGPGATKGDFDDGAEKEGINNIMNSEPMASSVASSGSQMPGGPLASGNSRYEDDGPSVKDRNESFRLRVEDPMFAVSQQQREKVLKAEKKKALYEKVIGPTTSDSDEHSYGEMKKRSKEERKKRKKKKRSRRDEDDDRKRRRRSRSRSNEHRRKHHRRDRSDSPRRHEYYDDSRSDYKDRKRSQHKEEKWDSRERKGREDERSARRYGEDDQRSRRADRSSRNDHDYGAPSEKHRDHDRSHSGTRGSHDHGCDGDGRVDGSNQKFSATGSTRYGLQGGSKVPVSASNLGPDKDLLRKKREEKEAERRRVRETASSRRHVSSSDRAKALEEMKADAKRRDDAMTRNASRRPLNDSDGKVPARGRATFLHDMTKQTHGIDDGGMSLSARVAQNRHTNQRSHDSFL